MTYMMRENPLTFGGVYYPDHPFLLAYHTAGAGAGATDDTFWSIWVDEEIMARRFRRQEDEGPSWIKPIDILADDDTYVFFALGWPFGTTKGEAHASDNGGIVWSHSSNVFIFDPYLLVNLYDAEIGTEDLFTLYTRAAKFALRRFRPNASDEDLYSALDQHEFGTLTLEEVQAVQSALRDVQKDYRTRGDRALLELDQAVADLSAGRRSRIADEGEMLVPDSVPIGDAMFIEFHGILFTPEDFCTVFETRPGDASAPWRFEATAAIQPMPVGFPYRCPLCAGPVILGDWHRVLSAYPYWNDADRIVCESCRRTFPVRVDRPER